jgi:hypothetical protein
MISFRRREPVYINAAFTGMFGYTPASKQMGSETFWRNLDATSFRDFSTRALSPFAFGRWLLDHRAERPGAMLRRVD